MNQATNEVELDTLDGERGLPSVNARKSSSAKKGLGVLFMVAVMLAGAGFIYFWMVRRSQAEASKPPPKSEQVENKAPAKLFADAPPPPPEAPQEALAAAEPVPAIGTVDLQPQAQPQLQAGEPARPRPRLDKSASSLMVGGAEATGGAGSQGGVDPAAAIAPGLVNAGTNDQAGGQGSGGLGSLLSGTSTPMAVAGRLSDRNFTLAKGSFIDCVLQTRLDTTVPGMSSCVVTRNIYSDNGKVLLIERGSTVIGEYTGGVQKGMNRIFVLWTRIKTPNGITMNLDSPGTDPLGASGLGGKVNTHFWKRFGAAMLLSLIDDAAATLSRSRGGDGNDTVISYGNSSDAAQQMAAKTLDKTIDIPPTLYKNQGERINIFVARDLYFGNVYALRTY